MKEKITWITTRDASYLRELNYKTEMLDLAKKNLDHCIYLKEINNKIMQ